MARRLFSHVGFVTGRRNRKSSVEMVHPSFISMADFLHHLSVNCKQSQDKSSEDSIARAALFHAPHLSADGSCIVLNYLARFGDPASTNVSLIVSRITERLQDSCFQGYSGKDIAIVLNALVRLRKFDKAVFEQAASYLQRLPRTEFISEKHLGLILNAYARAGVVDAAMFASLYPRIESQLDRMGSQSCGNICHALGKLGMIDESTKVLVSKISLRLLKRKAATNQELSNVIHSVAKLQISEADIIEPLLQTISKRINTFNPVEVAAVATALVKLDISDKELMRKICKRVSATKTQFNAYELTAVLHAASRLDVPIPTGLFEQFNPELLRDSNSHTACIALCAYARVGIIPSDTLAAAMSELIRTESNGQYLVDVLFGLSRFDNLPGDLEELLYTIAHKLRECDYPRTAANINQMIFSLKKLRSTYTADPVLLDLYEQAIVQVSACIESLEERHIANILFSIASSQDLSENETHAAKLLSHSIVGIKNPQLFSSCVESVATLALSSASLWNQIERRIRITIPDSANIDVRTAQALAHVGRLRGQVAQILLQRISVDKLSISSCIALLYTIAFAKVENPNTLDSLVDTLMNRVPYMTIDQFKAVAALLVHFGIERFPFSLANSHATELRESPMLMMHSAKHDQDSDGGSTIAEISAMYCNSFDDRREEWMPYLESLLAFMAHRPSSERFSTDIENIVAPFVHQMNLSELLRIIPYLPVSSSSLVVPRCLEVLRVESDKCCFEGIGALSRLNSTEINYYITQKVIPNLISSSPPVDVVDFISKSLERS